VAATVLCAWSHPGRCRSDAAFAMLGGAAPIPASSGQTVRVRLNRSGDRQLNQALDTAVLTRLRTDPATRAYATRRRAQGKTNPEIRRGPVRVQQCQPPGLLASRVHIDLVDTDEEEARRRLLSGVDQSDARPPSALFPGTAGGARRFPGQGPELSNLPARKRPTIQSDGHRLAACSSNSTVAVAGPHTSA
jgi:hypothetical protein